MSSSLQEAPVASLRRGTRSRTVAAGIALAAIVAMLFSPWWATGRVLAPLDIVTDLYAPWNADRPEPVVHNHFTSDAVTQYLVYQHMAARSFELDGSIGWSELTGGGRPEYANTMALYGDWTMQLHRWLPFWSAWHVGLIGQLLIAGIGMLVFLRGRRVAPAIALAGAAAYTLNTQFILWPFHRWHLAAFAWVPWLAWAVLRRPDRWSWVLVPALIALSLLGGNLQTNVFTFLVLAGLWVGTRTRRGVAARESEGPRVGDEDPAAPSTSRFVLWGLLGVALSSFVLIPAVFALLEAPPVATDRIRIGYPNGLMQPLMSLIFLPAQLFPTLLGSPRTVDLTKALKLDLAAVAFFGFVPTLIAYRAALHRRAPAAARWLVALGLLIPLTPLVSVLYHRVQVVFVFGGVWAFAWYWQEAGEERPLVRRAVYVLCACVAAWLAVSIATVPLEASLTEKLLSVLRGRIATGAGGAMGGVYPEWVLSRARGLVPDLRIWSPRQLCALVGIVLGGVAFLVRERRGPELGALVLLPAVLIELIGLGAGWVSFVPAPPDALYPLTPEIAAVQQEVGGGRVFIVDSTGVFFPPNTLAMFDVATLQEYESVAVDGMWQRAGQHTDPATLAAVGVTHALARPGHTLAAGWTPVYQGRTLALWHNDRAQPRYRATSRISSTSSAAAADPTASNPTAPDSTRAPSTRVSDSGGEATVEVLAATPNHRLLRVPTSTSALRVAENWSEGWQYREGSGPWQAVVAGADGSMELPLAGQSPDVEMRYKPARRAAGRGVSLMALLACMGMAAAPRRRAVAA